MNSILSSRKFLGFALRGPNKYRAAAMFLNGSRQRSYTRPAYCNRVGSEPLSYQNLGQQLLRAVDRYGDRVALVSCNERSTLSFQEAKVQAEVLALQLQHLGLRRGEHVGIWAPNTTQWYISCLAAALAGYPLVCLNPALQAQEMEYALRKAKVRALITMETYGKQNFYKVLQQLLPQLQSEQQSTVIESEQLPELRALIVKSAQENLTGTHCFDALLNQPTTTESRTQLNAELPLISPESACNIQFTSGTTGQPKATLLTHFNFVNESHIFGQRLSLHEGHKNICVTVPFFHVFGLTALISALDYGATLVLPSASFQADAALESIERERCHVVLGTPTMYVDMLHRQRVLQRSMESLEIGIVGGAACSPDVHARATAEFGLRQMRVAYGMSESTSATFMQDGTEQPESAVHTVGKMFEHAEAKVVNQQGETVQYGEVGELCVRGFFTMGGYFEDADKTNEVLGLDGWLKTGDEFILEDNGIGRFVGRKKELIIRGGENIFPKEIEDYLDTHEDILESQVIGVPDERMGEELCVFLRLKEGVATMTLDQIKQYCKGKIAYFKVPRYVRVVQNFPKTTSGKIQKFKLREMFESEH